MPKDKVTTKTKSIFEARQVERLQDISRFMLFIID